MKSLAMTGLRAAGFAAAAVLLGGVLAAQVRVTCITEPNTRLKNATQLGCDFRNLGAQPVVLSAGDVRDGTFERIGSPLRYSVANAMIEDSEKRGFWGMFFQVAKWIAVAASFAQGLDYISLGDSWRYLIPTLTGGLQAIDGVGRAQHRPLEMPPDYLPEGEFVLDGNESRAYVLLAAKPVFTTSFRVTLSGRTLALATPGGFVPASGTRSAWRGAEPLDVERMNRAALDSINELVYEVVDDGVYRVNLSDAAGIFYSTKEGPIEWVAAPETSEAVLEVSPREGQAAVAASQSIGESPLPLSSIRGSHAVPHAAALADWVAVGELTRRNMARF